MDFVFGHQAKPFPESDACTVGSYGFFVQVIVGELLENFHGFAMQAVEVGEDGVVAFGEFFCMAGIAAGLEARVFGPHVALGSGDVAEKIAESEAARFESPFDLRGWDTAGDTEGARTDFFKLIEELSCFRIFHLPTPEFRDSRRRDQGLKLLKS